MKKFIRKWSRQNFSRQITVVYTAIVVTMVLCIMGFTMLYLTRIMENKILDLFENALHQTALNLSTTLEAYNSSLNQVIVEQEFLEAVDGYETAYGYAEQELRLQLWDSLQTYQSYQPKVRCMVVRTEGGKVFSVDRLDEESLYQAPPQLYQEYFTKSQPGEETERRLLWIGTEYLDRKGTSDYYVFTLKRPLYNWYNNRYVGELYMGIDEEVLVGIEQEAKTAQSRDLFLIDESNRIVSHEKKAYIGQDAAELFDWSCEDHEKKLFLGSNYEIIRTDRVEGSGWYLVSVLDRQDVFRQMSSFYMLLIVLTIALVIVAMFLITYMSRRLSDAARQIVNAMEDIEEGEMTARAALDEEDQNEFTRIAAQFNSMMNRINEQVELIRESGQKEKEAELAALEAQINPHFIYNTLDSINWMAIENQEYEISEMLSEFAQILRYQIRKSTKLVSIGEELSYLEKYLHLQKMRFSDTFEYQITCEAGAGGVRIHKMLFQPLIENAVVHAFENIDYGGYLKVAVETREQGWICFVISDNGVGMEEEKIRLLFYDRRGREGSIGIPNVMARLDAYYGENYRIEVVSKKEEGTTIRVWIPGEETGNAG